MMTADHLPGPPPAHIIQSGRGKNRDPWLIRRYLDSIGLTMKDVAAMVRTPHNVVSDTVRGVRNHKRTLDCLESLGCPLSILYPLEHAHAKEKAA
jgi:hypothetical protein